MTWVMPKPTPSEKLESVGWEEEQHMGPPWKHLQALNKREKKVHTLPRPSCLSSDFPYQKSDIVVMGFVKYLLLA